MALVTQEHLAKMATLATAAAMEPKLWSRFLECVSLAPGIRTHLIRFDANGQSLGEETHGYDPAYLDSYGQHYAELNAWAPGFLTFGEGEVVDSRRMCADGQLFRTEWYNDWIKPQDDISLGGGSIIANGVDGTFIIGANIPRRSGEVAVANWLSLLKLMVPQLRNAWEISKTLTSERLGGSDVAIVVVREDRRIEYLNKFACNLLAEGTILRTDARARIKGTDLTTDNFLDAMLRHLRGSRCGGHSYLVKPANSQPVKLHGTVVNSSFLESSWPLFSGETSGPRLLLTVSSKKNSSSEEKKLTTALGLTRVEALVSIALARGLSPREIAEERSVSENTIRNQIRSIMSKAEVHRQTELALLVSRLIDDQPRRLENS